MTPKAINLRQLNLPQGMPLSIEDLGRAGISSALAHEYVTTGWLVRLGRGVFMFTGDQLRRDPSIQFLARSLPNLHVAGKTALAWQGFVQNLAPREVICLHGLKKATLPDWFQERFPARYHAGRLFDEELPEDQGLATLPESPDGPLVSAPERALLEMLSEVGVHQEADEARGIMESLRSPRMTLLGELLRHCQKVKAARLCVVWAEELGLPWAGAAREAATGRLGQGRWIRRLKDGSLLIVKS
ncbi:type IV toxin-antitoxin system AbiEi family antitoxin domain-containing protein [Prosthecobacter sp.]|uniref:type IV toxin-antitoxin system AbiEi family antitoxin domain-containing protein n=1 Tax=Prosthecobacter sp. TaxID=1965333 RepID=UPI0025DB5DDD|nr:type IV toxin-antitoxin system AbiEi family antitoxin domain-containing protein [Prosthecobacter sp.]